MGSQRGGGGMSAAQTSEAQNYYSSPRPSEQIAIVSPSSLIKRRAKVDTTKTGKEPNDNASKN